MLQPEVEDLPPVVEELQPSENLEQFFLPVEGVRIQGAVTDLVAEFSMVQSFRNQESEPIEVSFVFPIDRTSAVSSFSVEVGGRVLKVVYPMRVFVFGFVHECLV